VTVTLDRTPDGHVAILRFTGDHPMNVFTLDTLEALRAQVAAVAADRAVRVLILMGKEAVFSGGADLTYLGALDDDEYRRYIATEYALFAEVEALPLVTVAAIAGPCVGNATELALACDFRICAGDARIGLPEMRVGFAAPAQRLTAYLGIGRAKELIYSGRLLAAREALDLGLVTTVTDDLVGELEKASARYASWSAHAFAHTKQGIQRCYARAFDAEERAAAFATFRGPDFAEGAAAALAGRRPAFTGLRP
jgi:enoyl-CoA hydratase/carnithine racemase